MLRIYYWFRNFKVRHLSATSDIRSNTSDIIICKNLEHNKLMRKVFFIIVIPMLQLIL